MSQTEYLDRADKTLFKVRWISERALWRTHTRTAPRLETAEQYLARKRAQARP